MTEFYPRVMIVNGTAFGLHSATSITMTNLFRGWPIDRIAMAYFEDIESSSSVCRNNWRFSLSDVPLDRSVRDVLRWRGKRGIGSPSAGIPNGLVVHSPGVRKGVSYTLHGVASAWADLLPIKPPPAFWDWVDEFKPDVIYSMLGSIRITELVQCVARRLQVPIVPHFMDDWLTTYYRGYITAIPRKIMLSRVRSIFKDSPYGMTICATMSEEYRNRFGIQFEDFMNCMEMPETSCAINNAFNARPLTLAYVGGLHLNRWRSLVDIGRAIEVLRKDGLNIELAIYTPPQDRINYAETFSSISAIRVCESLSQDQVGAAMSSADILVHVESFDHTVREYTRLSLSTKVPQYMASGRPILVYGPAELASSKYIHACQCGLVVGKQNDGMLLEAVRLLTSDHQLRAQLGRRGLEMATENHNGDNVRLRFRKALAAVITSHRSRHKHKELPPFNCSSRGP